VAISAGLSLTASSIKAIPFASGTTPVSSSSNPQAQIVHSNHSYPIIKEEWGDKHIVNNESEASSVAGFDVKFPSWVESGYKLRLAAVDSTVDNNRYVWLFYSPNPISDNERINEFWAHGGINIIYHKTVVITGDNTFSSSTLDFHRSDVKLSIDYINGSTIHHRDGVGFNGRIRNFNGLQTQDPAQVDFIDGGTFVTLQGFKTITELTKIAESIP
jgi:hypothetical protein